MELTLPQLLQGKATKIKDKEYYTTEQYVTPFLEKCQSILMNLLFKLNQLIKYH